VKDNLEGFILKKSTSLLLSGILVSGMVLGTIVTPATVHAAEGTTATADKNVTNKVTFYDQDGAKVGSELNIPGVMGTEINSSIPTGYVLADNNTTVFGADDAEVAVKIAKVVTGTVNYVDQNDKALTTEKVTGGIGNSYKLKELPTNCVWNKDSDQTITINNTGKYTVSVTKKIANLVIFKTSDNTEVDRKTILGSKVGDVITLTSDQLPKGYVTENNKVTLQNDGNTQTISVTKAATDGTSDVNGVVTVKSEYGQLYDKTGKALSRKLENGTGWQTRTKMSLDGADYYLVGGNEWLKSDDVTYKANDGSTSTDTDDSTTTDNSGVVKPDKEKVETNTQAFLYDDKGTLITNRRLAKNTLWKTDQMKMVNGVKMYRVATNEWIKSSEIK